MVYVSEDLRLRIWNGNSSINLMIYIFCIFPFLWAPFIVINVLIFNFSQLSKEEVERDLRRQRLMEAERVRETYKHEIEERRMRREARERSRSRERKQRESCDSDHIMFDCIR